MATLRASSTDERIDVYFNTAVGTAYISVPDKKGVIQVVSVQPSDIPNLINTLERFKELTTATLGEGALM